MTRKSFGLLAAMMCLALLALPVSRVQAEPSDEVTVTVTITQTLSVSLDNGSWDAGSNVSLGGAPDTVGALGPDYFTAENDGDGPEDLTVTVSGSANWTAGTAPGADVFAMNLSTNGGSDWTLINPSGGASLATSLAAGGTQAFDLQLLVPTSTAHFGVQQSITVTVTAAAG